MNQYSKCQIFCEVISSGSFTEAASRLGYSQSAVSQAVRSIEQELGTQLLERRKDGLGLTADGKEFLPYIKSVSTAEAALRRKKSEMDGMQSTLVRIGAFTSVTRAKLPDLMLGFRSLYPGVSFEIKQGDYDNIHDWLIEGSIDFGFINMDCRNGLDGKELYTDRLMAVLPEGHELAAYDEVPLVEIAKHTFILVGEGNNSSALRAFEEHAIPLSPAFTIDDDYTVLSMIRRGLGVSLLYEAVVSGFEQGIIVRPVLEAPWRTVGLVWVNRDTLPFASRCFADYILASMGAE